MAEKKKGKGKGDTPRKRLKGHMGMRNPRIEEEGRKGAPANKRRIRGAEVRKRIKEEGYDAWPHGIPVVTEHYDKSDGSIGTDHLKVDEKGRIMGRDLKKLFADPTEGDFKRGGAVGKPKGYGAAIKGWKK